MANTEKKLDAPADCQPWRASHDFRRLRRPRHRVEPHHPYLLISTMSPVSVPRSATIILSSGDQAKRKIVSDVKFVNCFAGLPSKGCSQTFETPSRLSIKLKARPSGVQRIPASTNVVGDLSNTLTGSPPSNGRTANLEYVSTCAR